MKKVVKNIFVIGCVLLFSNTLMAQAFVHPGLLNNKQELDFVKNKIANSEQPWKAAHDRLKASNPQNRKPSPRANQPDEKVTPNANDTWDIMIEDGSTAYACALLWYHSGNQVYANKAVEILNAWSIFNYHPNGLYLSWAVPQFLNAAEILRYNTSSGWKKADLDKFETMVRTKFMPAMRNGTWVNNAQYSVIEGQIACAIFLDDRREFNTAITRLRDWIPNYIYLEKDGKTPELVGRTTIGYWDVAPGQKFLNGQCQETCRDLNHTKLGTTSIMYSAEYAYKQGIDIWKEEQERLVAFAELHASWMMGASPVPQNLCAKKGISCVGRNNGAVRGTPPCNQVAWEILCNHYITRLGQGTKLTNTKRMLLAHRPEGAINARNNKFETLTHANLPLNTIVTSIDEEIALNESEQINVFPNPSNDGLFSLSQVCNWKIFYITGKELVSGKGNQINLSESAKGVYLIKIDQKIQRLVID